MLTLIIYFFEFCSIRSDDFFNDINTTRATKKIYEFIIYSFPIISLNMWTFLLNKTEASIIKIVTELPSSYLFESKD